MLDKRPIGLADHEYIERLEREVKVLAKEVSGLRQSESSLRRKVVYMEDHYVPKAVRR